MEEISNNIVPVNKKENLVKYKTENIKNLIHTIRGKQVMLDSDVAMLYHYETKNINKAMKRNIERFPKSINRERNRKLEVPIWNLKFNQRKSWWKKVFTVCLYRTRNIYVSRSFKE